PDGQRIATCGADSAIKLWDVYSFQDKTLLSEVATLTGHDGPVTSVAFSPDGNTLASASADGTVRLWHAPPFSSPPREPAKAQPPPPTETTHLFWLPVWQGAQATLAREGNIHRVDVTALGTYPGNVSLLQLFDDFQEGASYSVRFRARANPPRKTTL